MDVTSDQEGHGAALLRATAAKTNKVAVIRSCGLVAIYIDIRPSAAIAALEDQARTKNASVSTYAKAGCRFFLA